MGKIVTKTLEGIARAQHDYKTLSGGYWLWMAPEHFVTSCIAREIRNVGCHTYYLTLESGVRDTTYAGGRRSGRSPSALRLNGKFDIVLWWGNNHPRAVIEVTKQVTGFSTIRSDVARICTVLSQPPPPSTFQCGLVVFYASKYLEGRPNDVESRLKDRLEKMKSTTEKFANNQDLHLDWTARPMERDEDSAWTAVVARINRQ